MTRRMSCSLTIDAVRARTKTVTRRHVDTWKTLAPGDRLVLVEKAMGLPKGARQVQLDEVVVIDVRVETLDTPKLSGDAWSEVIAEGLWEQAAEPMRTGSSDHSPWEWFVEFWLSGHGYPSDADPGNVLVRRIEWRYIDPPALLPIARQGDELAVHVDPGWIDAWRVDDDKAVLFYPDPTEVRFLHRCDRTTTRDAGIVICSPALQIGAAHTIVQRDPLTIVASILCPDCGTHGHVTNGGVGLMDRYGVMALMNGAHAVTSTDDQLRSEIICTCGDPVRATRLAQLLSLYGVADTPVPDTPADLT